MKSSSPDTTYANEQVRDALQSRLDKIAGGDTINPALIEWAVQALLQIESKLYTRNIPEVKKLVQNIRGLRNIDNPRFVPLAEAMRSVLRTMLVKYSKMTRKNK